MIASPGDCSQEREIAREVIYDWNNINSETRKMALAAIGWEYNTTPEMGDRPQEIINLQILDSADILIGIFGTRVGSSTGKAMSGTVEEIQTHLGKGKDVMLYFSKKPVKMEDVDISQYEALKKLKSEFQGQGLTSDFDSDDDFREKLQRHLSIKLNEPKYQSSSAATVEKPAPANAAKLSDKALLLLKEAAQDASGDIVMDFFGGGAFVVQTNGKELNEDNTARTKAAWEDAIEELVTRGFMKRVSEVAVQITEKGYQAADSIKM